MAHHGDYSDKDSMIFSSLMETLQKEYEKIKEKDNRFPDGKLNESDKGEFPFAVGIEKNSVVIHFAEPCSWIGFTPEQAIEVAELLIQKARALGVSKPVTFRI